MWLRSFVVALLCTLGLLSSASPPPCASVLLTTSFGISGSLIATLDARGQLTRYQDGFTQAPGLPAPMGDSLLPRFTTKVQNLPLLPAGRPRSLGSVASFSADEGFFVAVSDQGQLLLTLPDGRSLDILLPKTSPARAASFFQLPAQKLESRFIPMVDGIRAAMPTPKNHKSKRELSKRLDTLARANGISLMVATENTLYASTVTYRCFHPDAEEDPRELDSLLNTVRTGVTDAWIELETGKYERWEKNTTGMVDFSRASSLHRVLLPTHEENWIIEIGSFRPVLSLSEDTGLMDADFLQALDASHVLVASELGQVLLIDIEAQKVEHRLFFPSTAWMSSVTAQRMDDRTEIWAINRVDGHLYHWDTSEVGGVFRVADFPSGVAPYQVASFVSPVPVRLGRPAQSSSGYYINFRMKPSGVWAEQTLVLGSDGRIYAYRDRIRSAGDLSGERHWVSFPFP